MKLFDWILVALLAGQVMLWRESTTAHLDTVELFKPDLVFRDVEAIEIRKGRDRISLAKSGTQWELPAYRDYPVVPRAAESLIVRLAGYYPGPVVGRGEKDARAYRVDEARPHMQLRLRDAGGRVRSVYLAPAPGDSDFVRVEGDERIFRLEPPLSRQIDTNPRLWIDPVLCSFDSVPSRFNFSMGGQEYRIGFDGRDFRWRNEILDKQKIINFCRSISRLAIDEPIGMADLSQGTFSPMTLFLDFPENPIRLHLWHHMTQSGVSGYRVRVNEDPREVFILEHRLGGLFRNGLVTFLPDDRIPKDNGGVIPPDRR